MTTHQEPRRLDTVELVDLLARKAKELTEGMQSRVKRNPDVADYWSCFVKAIKEAEYGE